MSELIVADAGGIASLVGLVPADELTPLFDNVTSRFDAGQLRFPRSVADELGVIARGGFAAGWSAGLGDKKDRYAPDWSFIRDVMALAQKIGFDSGVEPLDGKDPAILDVARLCYSLEAAGVDFVVLSVDTGSNPLVPTMEQLCVAAGWKMIDPADCCSRLNLFDY